MIVRDNFYSSRVRDSLGSEGMARVLNAEPREAVVRFARFRGAYTCHLQTASGSGAGTDLRSAERAFDKARRSLAGEMPGIVSLLNG